MTEWKAKINNSRRNKERENTVWCILILYINFIFVFNSEIIIILWEKRLYFYNSRILQNLFCSRICIMTFCIFIFNYNCSRALWAYLGYRHKKRCYVMFCMASRNDYYSLRWVRYIISTEDYYPIWGEYRKENSSFCISAKYLWWPLLFILEDNIMR